MHTYGGPTDRMLSVEVRTPPPFFASGVVLGLGPPRVPSDSGLMAMAWELGSRSALSKFSSCCCHVPPSPLRSLLLGSPRVDLLPLLGFLLLESVDTESHATRENTELLYRTGAQ